MRPCEMTTQRQYLYNVANRAEAASYATRAGLADDPDTFDILG